MNKLELNTLSLEIRALLNKRDIINADQKLRQANLSAEAKAFVFKCLSTDGYNPQTGRFKFCESDNSEFLKLVAALQNKSSSK